MVSPTSCEQISSQSVVLHSAARARSRRSASSLSGAGEDSSMTLTLCIDRDMNLKPGRHVNHRGKQLRSIRVWWLWFAVAWYRFSDYHLVAEPHEWSES
jgi:hypothetical protein